MCDEYYGESVLHIAIVNEDPAAVKFLLDSGADIHERCYGTFMSPEDQKGTRYDVIEHEAVCVNPFTNYEGEQYTWKRYLRDVARLSWYRYWNQYFMDQSTSIPKFF